jgi:hypothetical protein
MRKRHPVVVVACSNCAAFNAAAGVKLNGNGELAEVSSVSDCILLIVHDFG